MRPTPFLLVLLVLPVVAVAQDADVFTERQQLFSDDLAVTRHEVRTAAGEVIPYTATAGYLPLRTETGDVRARVFFVAYTRDGVSDPATRPVTFTFNGGPGSSSVWLHLGGLAPVRVEMEEEGWAPPPPYRLVENPYTWLDDTDLVFIDPVTTGYSRAAEGVDDGDFHGLDEDVEAVADFIRLYTTRYERWASPKFLAGESYGTTRAAALAPYLQDRHGLYLNGVILISAVLNFQANEFDVGNDLPPIVFLPSFAATARYHGLLASQYQEMEIEAFLDEVEQFALTDYALALLQGDRLPEAERRRVIDRLAAYTGLSADFLDRADLRIHERRFFKELQRTRGLTTGRLDSRFTGRDRDEAGERVEFDPSYAAILGPFTATLNDHLRRRLGYENELPYEILTGRVRPWSYADFENRYVDVAEPLRQAMHKNPALKVLIANGYYDLATPYFATEHVVSHLGLAPELRSNVTMTYYESGHMMYIHRPSLVQLDADAHAFYESAVP